MPNLEADLKFKWTVEQNKIKYFKFWNKDENMFYVLIKKKDPFIDFFFVFHSWNFFGNLNEWEMLDKKEDQGDSNYLLTCSRITF